MNKMEKYGNQTIGGLVAFAHHHLDGDSSFI